MAALPGWLRAIFARSQPVPEDPDGLSPAERAHLDALRARIAALTADGILCHARPELPDGIASSRIGGPFAWPEGKPLPDLGGPVGCAIQIDLADLPKGLGLPEAGLMQLLLRADDVLGCDMPSMPGAGFALVVHPPGTAFESRDQSEVDTYHLPFSHATRAEGHALRFEAARVAPCASDHRMADLVFGADRSDAFEAAIVRVLDGARRPPADAVLLGNPDFTQSDVREDGLEAYETNILNLSSLGAGLGKQGGAYMWGDSGEAVVLMRPEDLRAQRWDRAIYSWDCC